MCILSYFIDKSINVHGFHFLVHDLVQRKIQNPKQLEYEKSVDFANHSEWYTLHSIGMIVDVVVVFFRWIELWTWFFSFFQFCHNGTIDVVKEWNETVSTFLNYYELQQVSSFNSTTFLLKRKKIWTNNNKIRAFWVFAMQMHVEVTKLLLEVSRFSWDIYFIFCVSANDRAHQWQLLTSRNLLKSLYFFCFCGFFSCLEISCSFCVVANYNPFN